MISMIGNYSNKRKKEVDIMKTKFNTIKEAKANVMEGYTVIKLTQDTIHYRKGTVLIGEYDVVAKEYIVHDNGVRYIGEDEVKVCK